MKNSNILTANGYRVHHTGGGCTAWAKDFQTGKSVLIGADGSHEIDDVSDFKQLGLKIVGQVDSEQGDLIHVESKDNDVQKLIRFVNFLNEMDNDSFESLAFFEPLITI